MTISPFTVTTPGETPPNSHNSCTELLENTDPTSLIPESVRGDADTPWDTPDTILAINGLTDSLSAAEIAMLDSPLAEPPGWTDLSDERFGGGRDWDDLSVEEQFSEYAQQYQQANCTNAHGNPITNCDNPFELDSDEIDFLQNCFDSGQLEECAASDQADTIMQQILAEQLAILNNCVRPDELAFGSELPEAIQELFEIRTADFDAAECRGDPALKPHVTAERARYQIWLLDDFFKEYLLPSMMEMTEQLTVAGMHQMMILGSFFDAELQLQAQRIIQKKTAEAHRDYQPSPGMCTFGTIARSLGASEQKSRYNAMVLGQMSLNRQIGVLSSAGSGSNTVDKIQRMTQFKERFCDKRDSGFTELCVSTTALANRDISMFQLLNSSRSYEIDFTDTNVTDDERAITEMSKHLFAHDLIERLTRSEIAHTDKQDEFIDFRKILAQRSVAEHSIYSIVGMKSAGASDDAETAGYMKAAMKTFGISSDEELKAYITDNPSYYAQLEFLAQRMYQTPDFYTGLYTAPSDVLRKEVSMQAIRLMLERNMYKSELRAEANLAVILSLELDTLKEGIIGDIEEINADRAIDTSGGGGP